MARVYGSGGLYEPLPNGSRSKVAGGVSSIDDALLYVAIAETVFGKAVDPDLFRIGSSSLLNSIIEEMGSL